VDVFDHATSARMLRPMIYPQDLILGWLASPLGSMNRNRLTTWFKPPQSSLLQDIHRICVPPALPAIETGDQESGLITFATDNASRRETSVDTLAQNSGKSVEVPSGGGIQPRKRESKRTEAR